MCYGSLSREDYISLDIQPFPKGMDVDDTLICLLNEPSILVGNDNVRHKSLDSAGSSHIRRI